MITSVIHILRSLLPTYWSLWWAMKTLSQGVNNLLKITPMLTENWQAKQLCFTLIMLRLEFRQAWARKAKTMTFPFQPFVPLNSRCHSARLYLCTVLLHWDRENCLDFFFFWIIIWDWCWSNLLALKAFLQGHRSVSNAGRSEDVRFQNQEVLAATTAWRSESDPNLSLAWALGA